MGTGACVTRAAKINKHGICNLCGWTEEDRIDGGSNRARREILEIASSERGIERRGTKERCETLRTSFCRIQIGHSRNREGSACTRARARLRSRDLPRGVPRSSSGTIYPPIFF